jgi:hypothetical protein
MSDFEEKDAITNAGFDAFMAEHKLLIADEETRAIFFEVWLGGMNFMLEQIVAEYKLHE